jgi:hypothetical protein
MVEACRIPHGASRPHERNSVGHHGNYHLDRADIHVARLGIVACSVETWRLLDGIEGLAIDVSTARHSAWKALYLPMVINADFGVLRRGSGQSGVRQGPFGFPCRNRNFSCLVVLRNHSRLCPHLCDEQVQRQNIACRAINHFDGASQV